MPKPYRWHEFRFTLVIAVAVVVANGELLFPHFPKGLLAWGELGRDSLARGEWWRIFGGNLVHYDLSHLLGNLVVWLWLGAICEPIFRHRYAWLFVATAVTVSLAEVCFDNFPVYRGLSGVNHGVVVTLLAAEIHNRELGLDKRLAALIATGFVAKLTWEWFGQSSLLVTPSGYCLAPLSHIAGAIAGLVFYFFHCRKCRTRRRNCSRGSEGRLSRSHAPRGNAYSAALRT